MQTIREMAIECLKDFTEVTLNFSDDTECTIGEAGNYLGGGDGYISEVLGNISYDTAESAVDATINYMKRNKATLIDFNS